jgi:hypothetical protein
MSVDSGDDVDLNLPPSSSVADSAACSRTEVQETTVLDIVLPKLPENAEKVTVALGHQELPMSTDLTSWLPRHH